MLNPLVWARRIATEMFSGDSPEDVASALERFLLREERQWDYDDYFAVPPKHRVTREVLKELFKMGFDIPPDERWRTDPQLRQQVQHAIERLRAAQRDGLA